MSKEAISGEAQEDESYFAVYLPEPTEQEMLSMYRIYRDGGGQPYEPYEHMLVKHNNGTLSNVEVGDAFHSPSAAMPSRG